METAEISQTRRWLAAARRVAVLTGAGMSAESGVPTFRDAATGLWSSFDPYQLASLDGFRADPTLVWRWYAWRRALIAGVEPNAGHRALAALQAGARFDRFDLLTQNVDGLHTRAGSVEVCELHGNILRSTCVAACGFAVDTVDALPPGEPPRCPRCGNWLRPGVVWFGESLDPRRIAIAEAASGNADLMLVVGTSGLVFPAAALPALTRGGGGKVVVINPNPTDLDAVADLVITGTAAVVLPALCLG